MKKLAPLVLGPDVVTRLLIKPNQNFAIDSPENPGPGQHQGFSSAVRAVQSISGAELAGGPINAGDAPALLFHGTNDGLVPYSWATDTVDRATAAGLLAVLRTWEGAGHVPYSQHRTQILDETRNFFYSQLDLAHAAR